METALIWGKFKYDIMIKFQLPLDITSIYLTRAITFVTLRPPNTNTFFRNIPEI